jgi:hypothetical protein
MVLMGLVRGFILAEAGIPVGAEKGHVRPGVGLEIGSEGY